MLQKSETREELCHGHPHMHHSPYVCHIHDIPRVSHQLDFKRFLGARVARFRRRRSQERQPLTRRGPAGAVISERRSYNITLVSDLENTESDLQSLIGDLITIWRAWILWDRDSRMLILPAFLWLAAFGECASQTCDLLA